MTKRKAADVDATSVTEEAAHKKEKLSFIDGFDTLEFDGPASKAYALMTDSEEFSAWSNSTVTVPDEDNFEFSTHGGHNVFKFLTRVQDKMIVAHYREAHWKWSGFATAVFVYSETEPGKTTLKFSLYGIPGGENEREKQIMGWQEYFFKPMGAHLLKSKPMPFCWVDLPVKDTGRAQSFYEALFNWNFFPGILDNEPFFSTGYSRDAFGGCLTHKMKSPRMYIGVRNLEETLELAKANGGEVMGKIQPAGDYGRHCSIKDTEGNIMGLYCMGKMEEDDLED
ncbi:hypothetical protein BJ742DRAFT_819221 [Cladochytrium replicatum]|nr:hypothetical protein BJ742DRAFT_819221 [Cladochytrium replicatum]